MRRGMKKRRKKKMRRRNINKFCSAKTSWLCSLETIPGSENHVRHKYILWAM
jgi:hypothetical protein